MDVFKDKNILIFGASGYIGSALVNRLKKSGAYLWGVSSRESEDFNSIIVDWKSFKLDEDKLPEQIDYIYFLSAQTSTYQSNEFPVLDLEQSLIPMLRTLDYVVKKKQRPHIILASTATIFGLVDQSPVNESVGPNPQSIYDLHKHFAEQYLFHYVDQGLLEGHALRLCNIYGPGSKSSSNDRGIVHHMAKKAFNGETVTVYGEGEQIRDYLYIDDLVEALIVGAEKGAKVNGLYFILGSGTGISLKNAFQKVVDIAKEMVPNNNCELVHIEPPKGLSPIENRSYYADTKLFSSLTGWKAMTDYETGLRNYFRSIE